MGGVAEGLQIRKRLIFAATNVVDLELLTSATRSAAVSVSAKDSASGLVPILRESLSAGAASPRPRSMFRARLVERATGDVADRCGARSGQLHN